MERLKKVIAVLILLSSFPVCGQGQEHKAGFKIISTYDSSRTYKPNAVISDKLYYRPIIIDLWYPADIAPDDTTASFVDLVNLLEERSNFYGDTRHYDGLTEELLQYICAGLKDCSHYNILKTIKTDSYVNAKQIEQRFPLVIYLAGYNGMSYENYSLLESLARNGFVTASVSSTGRYPGDMTLEPEDVFEQIKDAEFIIRYLTGRNLASQTVGLIGYSWGGLAATIMAMTEPERIKAVVSLDGSEQFAYVGEEESKKLNFIRQAYFFKPEAIKSSFLYLDSDIGAWDNVPDSVYNMIDHISGDKDYLKIDISQHEDFSSLSALVRRGQSTIKYNVIKQLTVDYLLDKLKGEGDFYSNIPITGVTKHFSPSILKVDSGAVDTKVLKGLIRDKKSNHPLPYVNVGVLNREVGTTSDKKGEFELVLHESNENDTLRVSCIGYEPVIIHLKDVFDRRNLNIQMQEKTDELREILITEKKLATKVLGNKTNSKFFGGMFASGDLGSEIAIRIKIKKNPAYLDNFNFNISYNTGDTAAFRVNVYQVNDGLPDKNLLQENIIVWINGQSGNIDVDLSKYNIVVEDDFFIGLEWVEGKDNSGIVFSSGFVNKGTFYRKASQGRWKKYPMGVGFNVTVKH